MIRRWRAMIRIDAWGTFGSEKLRVEPQNHRHRADAPTIRLTTGSPFGSQDRSRNRRVDGPLRVVYIQADDEEERRGTSATEGGLSLAFTNDRCRSA